MIERPVFVVAPPRSGATALFRSLARAPGVFSSPRGGVMEGIFELEPENREWDSNRLTASDVEARAVEELRGRLKGGLVDSEGNRPGLDATGLRWVDGHPRNALRVPFLAAVAPDSQFVYIHRDPADTVPAMLGVWESGGRVSYPELPGWEGPSWSLPLVPGWRELAGRPLPEIVTEQWLRLTGILLDDLETLQPQRWCVTDFKTLLNDPQRELERICEFVARAPDHPAAHRQVVRAGGLSAAQRLHADLPRVPQPAAELAARLDLPDRQADLRALRRGPAQHPLPELPAADGAGGCAGADRDRDPCRGARLPRLPGRRTEGGAARQA
jgi:Sulfotransferase family